MEKSPRGKLEIEPWSFALEVGRLNHWAHRGGLIHGLCCEGCESRTRSSLSIRGSRFPATLIPAALSGAVKGMRDQFTPLWPGWIPVAAHKGARKKRKKDTDAGTHRSCRSRVLNVLSRGTFTRAPDTEPTQVCDKLGNACHLILERGESA